MLGGRRDAVTYTSPAPREPRRHIDSTTRAAGWFARSARGDEVAEHTVRRVKHRDHRAPERIVFGQVTPEEPLLGSAAVRSEDRNDDDIGVECAHRLHANELES